MSDTLHQTITLTATGASNAALIRRGKWALELFATDWSGATVTVQFAGSDVSARYQTIIDPLTGEPVSRTANGSLVIFESGGGYLRLNTADLSDATGVTLVAKRVF